MKLYRNCNRGDIQHNGETYVVVPKKHTTHNNTTIPSGEWSFWTKEPLWHACPIITVVAEFQPELGGIQTFHEDFDDDYLGGLNVCQVPEFVTSTEIEIDEIYINSIFEDEAPNDPLVKFAKSTDELQYTFSDEYVLNGKQQQKRPLYKGYDEVNGLCEPFYPKWRKRNPEVVKTHTFGDLEVFNK